MIILMASVVHHPSHQLNRNQVERQAWATVIVAFFIACALLILASYALWSYRVNAMSQQAAMLILRAPSEWVNVQRKGHTIFEQARDLQTLDEGYRVSIASSAGYGQATTIRLFDQSTIDMWSGADLLLEKLQTSRWNQRSQVVSLQQHNGYIRYDVTHGQPYDEVLFQVVIGETHVELAPGGSYSIDIKPPERQVLFVSATDDVPQVADVAVRSGSAIVYSPEQTVFLGEGQKLVINPVGQLSSPMSAEWQLIRDGTFNRYSEEEYNNTTIVDQPALSRSQTWQVFSGASVPDASGGFFRLSHGCPPPNTGNDCPPHALIKAAWFIRSNDQTNNFTTGVVQQLGPEQEGLDISEYRSLKFSIWVRVLYQSVKLTGERGTECPMMIRFLAKEKHPKDPEQERVICLYTNDGSQEEPEKAPGIRYYEVQPYAWYNLVIDLRDPTWLPESRYLRSIELFANGHDYDSRATMVSLVGKHQAR